MSKIDRKLFVPAGGQPYDDSPQVIGVLVPILTELSLFFHIH